MGGLSLLPLLSSFFTMTSQTADTTKDNATRPESQSASSSTRTAELASTKKKLHTSLRNFPDFPIKGIDFVDILLLFAPSLALRLGAGFAPVRKRGKLPGPTSEASFE